MQRNNTITVITPDKKQSIINIDRSKRLGKGSYGEVYSGVSPAQQALAVKEILLPHPLDEERNSAINNCTSEIAIMESLAGPEVKNIIQIHGYFSDNNRFIVAMNYAPNGSLTDLIKGKKNSYLLPQQQRQVLIGAANGLAYMHEKNILHCDIKPCNVLLDENMNAFLCDFGLSKRKGVDNLFDVVGSILFSAPELLFAIFNGSPNCHSDKSDMYSFSLLCWCVVAQAVIPFKAIAQTNDEFLMFDSIVNKGKRETIPDDCPKDIANFIVLAWNAKPKMRPSAKAALQILHSDKSNMYLEQDNDLVPEMSLKNPPSVSVGCFATFFSQLDLVNPKKKKIHLELAPTFRIPQ